MPKTIIAPSILSSDFTNIHAALDLIAESGGDWIHLDVMDGKFVPNITFGPKMVADIRPKTRLPLDVHLMIAEPEKFADQFIEAGADFLTFHLEACIHAHRLVQRIREKGCKAGISIVPSTPPELVYELLPDLDLLLVMTVNPGFGGQKMIGQCVEKARTLSRMRQERELDFLLAVDGGVNRDTVASVKQAGCDVIVSGSSFFGSDNPAEEVRAYRTL